MTRAQRSSIGLALLVLVSTPGCVRDSWKAFVYPDADNLTVDHRIGPFSSLEDCRIAAQSYMAALGVTASGDYECGKNCQPVAALPEMYMCEETKR